MVQSLRSSASIPHAGIRLFSPFPKGFGTQMKWQSQSLTRAWVYSDQRQDGVERLDAIFQSLKRAWVYSDLMDRIGHRQRRLYFNPLNGLGSIPTVLLGLVLL